MAGVFRKGLLYLPFMSRQRRVWYLRDSRRRSFFVVAMASPSRNLVALIPCARTYRIALSVPAWPLPSHTYVIFAMPYISPISAT